MTNDTKYFVYRTITPRDPCYRNVCVCQNMYHAYNGNNM